MSRGRAKRQATEVIEDANCRNGRRAAKVVGTRAVVMPGAGLPRSLMVQGTAVLAGLLSSLATRAVAGLSVELLMLLVTVSTNWSQAELSRSVNHFKLLRVHC